MAFNCLMVSEVKCFIVFLDSTLIEAHLLLAQVHISQEELELASQALDNSLSCNFKVCIKPFSEFQY